MAQKEKEYTFDHFPSEDELKSTLFSLPDDNDPASINYKRKLYYPKINWWLVIFNLLWSSSLIIATVLLLHFLVGNIYLTIFIPLGMTLLLFGLFIKQITIFMIHMYQLIAPTKIRMKCRFEPSCSVYMIKAIEKYGYWKGLKKGINRLKRCCYPNGGYDKP